MVLGGPSVSACPEYYPDFDYLHIGEMGDATEDLFARLERDIARPEKQIALTTDTRRELSDFPLPAYELCRLEQYFMGSIQFSSGCPYDCEFCDIPALYGRNPRLKNPEQITAELDKMRAHGLRSMPSISWTTISSATGVRCASFCPCLSNGRSAIAIR